MNRFIFSRNEIIHNFSTFVDGIDKFHTYIMQCNCLRRSKGEKTNRLDIIRSNFGWFQSVILYGVNDFNRWFCVFISATSNAFNLKRTIFELNKFAECYYSIEIYVAHCDKWRMRLWASFWFWSFSIFDNILFIT